MKHTNPPSLSQPRGYSHVVEVTGGRTIYVSGQVAIDEEGRVVGEGHFETQTQKVFENLRAALAAADATLEDVVKITVFVTDMAQLPTFRAVRNAYFRGSPPASTLVEVSSLVLPELLIEIEAVAVVGASPRS